MALSSIISEMKRHTGANITRDSKSRFFISHLNSAPCLGSSRRNLAIMFGTEKKTRIVDQPGSEKGSWYIDVSVQYWRLTDGYRL